MARFIGEVIEGSTSRHMIGACRRFGSLAQEAFSGFNLRRRHSGIFQPHVVARKYDSVAFRYIAANDHPDRDTIATFMPSLSEQHGYVAAKSN